VIVDLEITNKLHLPVAFDPDQEQTQLLLGENTYTEDFEAENGGIENSFVGGSKEIQPDNTATGAVVFDVPTKRLHEIETNGNLEIGDFSEPSHSRLKTVGVFRTYR
jgi:hypothetical protein